jgi:hypothetical protein
VYPDVHLIDACFPLTAERREVNVGLVGDVAHHAAGIFVAVGIVVRVVCGSHCG